MRSSEIIGEMDLEQSANPLEKPERVWYTTSNDREKNLGDRMKYMILKARKFVF